MIKFIPMVMNSLVIPQGLWYFCVLRSKTSKFETTEGKTKHMANDPIIRDKFDFDIGHLVKSPCNDCDKREHFPKCIDQCELLDHLQRKLAKGISSNYSSQDA